jgi:hypothetical protein
MIAPDEQKMTLTQAAAWLPRRRGRRTHVSTLYRWTQTGCRGVRLEYVQIGATRCTSLEALQRFFDRLTRDADRRSRKSPEEMPSPASGSCS